MYAVSLCFLIKDSPRVFRSILVHMFLTVFVQQGFAAHKLAILVKLSGYIAETDKSFQKAPPAKIMYVVPVDVNLNNTADLNPDNEDGANNEDSTLDDTNGYGTPTHALPSPPRAVVAPPKEPEWPQTDFIKKHILDNNKLRSATKASAASPASRTLSRNASTPSSKSRSTTPTSVRHSGSFRRDDSGALNGIDIYDIEEKTAALEAIQALRAQRQGIAAPSPRQLDSQQQNASQASSSAQYNSFSGNSLTELAATEARGSFGCIPSAGGLSTAYSRPALSPQRSAEGSSLGVSPKNSAQSGTSTPRNFGTGNSGANNNSVANNSGASAVQLNPNSDFAVFIQQTVDAAVQQRLSNDPELQKVRLVVYCFIYTSLRGHNHMSLYNASLTMLYLFD